VTHSLRCIDRRFALEGVVSVSQCALNHLYRSKDVMSPAGKLDKLKPPHFTQYDMMLPIRLRYAVIV